MSLNDLGQRNAEIGNAGERSRVWARVLERFRHDPRAGAVLRLRRSRPDSELDAEVGDLVEALSLDPGDDPSLTAEIHAELRELRDCDGFEHAWPGEVPPWLALDHATTVLCVEWINTDSWSDSKAFLSANADQLLAPDAEVALAELELTHPGVPEIRLHLELLADCRRDGIDAAYRPVLLRETFTEWQAIDDPAEAKRFLLDHRDELMTAEAHALAAEVDDAVAHGILGLALEGDVDLAYALLDDPDRARVALADARRDGSPMTLIAIAQVTPDRAIMLVHIAIGLVLTHQTEQALEVLEQLPEEHPDAIADISDAIQHRPDHAVGLAALISALS